MSWLALLAKTYDLVPTARIGRSTGAEDSVLLPICHTTNKVQVEVVLDGSGNFLGASVVDPDDATTIIPCTEESGGRAGSKPKNHPLADKLQYLAGDFLEFGGVVTSGFLGDPGEPHRVFIGDLRAWCGSEFFHPKAFSVLTYVQKGHLLRDLIENQIILSGSDGLATQEAPENGIIPPLFKVLQGGATQTEAFVRWKVEIPGDLDSTTWSDASLWERWSSYYASKKASQGLCFVTGQRLPLADQHPAKIRNAGDKAKLISSNDGSGFTFRGRFLDSDEVCGVGFVVSQKAHNALRWLFARQGDQRTGFVAWTPVGNMDVPDPTLGTLDFLDAKVSPESEDYDAGQYVALQFRKKINGYRGALNTDDKVAVMGLDSATPGRMAVSYYREFLAEDFLSRLEIWHGEKEGEGDVGCAWFLDFGYDKDRKQWRRFWGAPSPKDIAEACYGLRLDDKLRRSTVERLMPSIMDGQPIPQDLVLRAVRGASNRTSLEDWEWRKILGIACALYRKSSFDRKEGRYEMDLEKDRKTRDYLYGRLLAVADKIERYALSVAQESRETNASRLMQRFAEHPFSTWRSLELSLAPYKARLGGRNKIYVDLIHTIMALFDPEDFVRDRPLSGEFLLGYHRQWFAFQVQKNTDEEELNEE